MSDDLVKRLRDHIAVYLDDRGHVFEDEALCDEAADRIEELEKKLAKAVEALDEAIYFIDIDEEDILKQAGMYRIAKSYAELGAVIPTEWADALKRVEELTGGKDE